MSIDVEEQYDKIYRYCYFKLQHQQTAEDITQETFLRYFQKYQHDTKDGPLKYLYTIARNLCIDEYRRQSADRAYKGSSREQTFMQIDNGKEDIQNRGHENRSGIYRRGIWEETVCADTQERQIITRLTVRKALSKLSLEEQELLLLRYVNEVPVAAIGQMFGLSRFAVRRRLLTVEKKFRKLLEKEGFT